MSGRISGKDVAITLKKAWRETLLNWLVRLKKMAAWDGRLLVDWGKVMNFLTWSCMVVIMRLLPLGVPTA